MLTGLRADLLLTLRVLLRQSGFWAPKMVFPARLFAFFAASLAGERGIYAMASFAVYAVVGVGFYQFGITVAQDRENPFARWQSTLPAPALAPWIARLLASFLFVAVAVVLVVVAGQVLGGLRPSPTALARLAGVCALSAVPATLLGMALGSVASARAAVPLANLVFLPLSYLGGLWGPPVALPAVINAISVWTPTRAMGELACAAVDGRALPQGFLLVLVAWSGAAALVNAKPDAATARHCSDRVIAGRRASAPRSCGLSSDPDARRRRS